MNKNNDLKDQSHTFVPHPKRQFLFALLFAAVASIAAFDLSTDIAEGASIIHLVTESILFGGGLVGFIIMVRTLLALRIEAAGLADEKRSLAERLTEKAAEASELSDELRARSAEAERWRTEARDLMRGLGVAIDQQFDEWELTDAEKEVGLLLLKGLSHKEIASVRGTAPATTRHQARSVYQKAGLSGRNDLAAFFLEDLLLPGQLGSAPAEPPHAAPES